MDLLISLMGKIMKRISLLAGLLMLGFTSVAYAQPTTTQAENTANPMPSNGITVIQNVIFNQGPLTGTVGILNYTNETAGHNFVEQFSFPVDTVVTDIHIFQATASGANLMHVKIMDDVAGTPTNLLYQEDKAADAWVVDPDSGGHAISVTLTQPFTALAGTVYWIGMSGTPLITQGSITLTTGGDGTMAMFSGDIFLSHQAVGDMMFQLSGAPAAPTPSYAVQLTGFGDCLNLWLDPTGNVHGNIPIYGPSTVFGGLYDKKAKHIGVLAQTTAGGRFFYDLNVATKTLDFFQVDAIGAVMTQTWTALPWTAQKAGTCTGVMNNGAANTLAK